MDNYTKKSDKIITAEEQSNLSPDDVIELLKEGNQRFINNNLIDRDHIAQAKRTTNGQFPLAIILSCIDSRVPVEYIFDKGIGDLFVARVAGNFINEDILGGMEYACKVSGSKIILVLGHEHCGAVKAAIEDVKMGNITAMLSKIGPAIKLTSEYHGEKSSKNPKYVQIVVDQNVHNTINDIRQKSPVLKEMEDAAEIRIMGAIYSLSTGKVEFWNNK